MSTTKKEKLKDKDVVTYTLIGYLTFLSQPAIENARIKYNYAKPNETSA